MINALAQNIDTQDTILNTLTQVNVNPNVQTEKAPEFSNFANNLDARFQKAQKNFEKKAKVTNTSSINQKALEKKDIKINKTDSSLEDTQSIKKEVEAETVANKKEVEIKTIKKNENNQADYQKQNTIENKDININIFNIHSNVTK